MVLITTHATIMTTATRERCARRFDCIMWLFASSLAVVLGMRAPAVAAVSWASAVAVDVPVVVALAVDVVATVV